MITLITPSWFKVNPSHTLHDQEGRVQPHLFFDVDPEWSKSEKSINVIITTPEASEIAYDLDLNSGQRHYSHTYCTQKDIWHSYEGPINTPSFSIGVVPRTLDQLGEAQKIIVFGGQKRFRMLLDTNYQRVHLVSAYVEQSCPEGNCIGKSNWLSRLVFIGVDVEESDLKSITDTETFKQRYDWKEIKAQLENIDGRNGIGEKTFPAIRVGQLIPISDALAYFKKNSIALSKNESSKIQKGCHALYEKLWADVGAERSEDRPAKTVEELKVKLRLKEDLRKQRLPVGFAARFRAYTQQYSQEISTCEKFVYHGNVNIDAEKFWFLSYAGIYFRLHREGHYFDCNKRAWMKNSFNPDGKLNHDLKKDVMECDEKDLDAAMEYLPNYLSGMRNFEKHYYRFIDYDTHPFGTHRKLYSWIKVKNRKFDCSQDPNERMKKEMRVFPEDVAWKSRAHKDIEESMKIIY